MANLFERNRKVILNQDELCGICGKYVDKELKTPHPLSAEIDHIIPKNKGGKDTLDNLQLTHRKCNRDKSDKINYIPKKEVIKAVFEQVVIFE